MIFLREFDPIYNSIESVVLGAGDWPINERLSEKDVIKTHLPFHHVITPLKEIKVQGLYSLDGKEWFTSFPYQQVFDYWRDSEYDVIDGVIRFGIEFQPDCNMSVREIGFYDGCMFAYKIIDEFIIGKSDRSYLFNYNLKCPFVSPQNINELYRKCQKSV